MKQFDDAINISNLKLLWLYIWKYQKSLWSVNTLFGAKSHAITVSSLASIWCFSNTLGSE